VKIVIEFLTLLGIISGGIIWLTTIDNRTRVVARDIEKLEIIHDDVAEIKKDLGVVRGRQEILIKHIIKAGK